MGVKDYNPCLQLKMRLSGKYTKDRNLTANEKKGIIDIITAYEVLKP